MERIRGSVPPEVMVASLSKPAEGDLVADKEQTGLAGLLSGSVSSSAADSGAAEARSAVGCSLVVPPAAVGLAQFNSVTMAAGSLGGQVFGVSESASGLGELASGSESKSLGSQVQVRGKNSLLNSNFVPQLIIGQEYDSVRGPVMNAPVINNNNILSKSNYSISNSKVGFADSNNLHCNRVGKCSDKGKEKMNMMDFGSISTPLSMGLGNSWLNFGSASEVDVGLCKNRKLKFVQPEVVNGEIVVKLSSRVAEDGAKRWAHTIVGYFLGKAPFFEQLNKYFKSIWKGLIEVKATAGGFYFFIFNGEKGLSEALEGGPWLFQGQPIFLRRWTFGITLQKEEHRKVPVWTKLRNIPTEYWTDEGLSIISSAVGEPLYADVFTKDCLRLDYARVCVLLDAHVDIPQHFHMILPALDGERPDPCRVEVEYEWVPHRCSDCRVFGHKVQVCPKKIKSHVPKRPSGSVGVYVTKEKTTEVSVASGSKIGMTSGVIIGHSADPGPMETAPLASREVASGTLSGIDRLRIHSNPVYSIITHSTPSHSPPAESEETLLSNRFACLSELGNPVDAAVDTGDDSHCIGNYSVGPKNFAAHSEVIK